MDMGLNKVTTNTFQRTYMSMEPKPKHKKVLNGVLALVRILKTAPQCSACLNDVLVEKSILISTTKVTRITKRFKDDNRPRNILPIVEWCDAGTQHNESQISEATLSPRIIDLIEILIQVEESTKEADKKTTHAITNLFIEVSGEDEEIGWVKLKKLLDAYIQRGIIN